MTLPIQLPTTGISNILKGLPQESEYGPDASDERWGDAYRTHPAVVRARQQGVHWSKTRPIALYTDGVQYTNNDSYITICVQDLRSGFMKLCVTVRSAPSLMQDLHSVSHFVNHA